jgi:hypothetical protein
MAMKITACLKFCTNIQSETHKHCKNNKLAARQLSINHSFKLQISLKAKEV